jgi:zinc transporter ZupT
MRLLADYWWLLAFPLVIILMIQSVRRTPRSIWVWVLRVAGGTLVCGALVWFITGDIDEPYLTLHFGGTPGAMIAIALGALALFGAHRVSARQGPPA